MHMCMCMCSACEVSRVRIGAERTFLYVNVLAILMASILSLCARGRFGFLFKVCAAPTPQVAAFLSVTSPHDARSPCS